MILAAFLLRVRRSWLSVAILALPMAQYSPVFGADEAPVSKTYDDSYIMSRVQLVGVIAGGSSDISGIAVIKDIHSGRSYAVKTGDALPGVSHIVLTKVQREVAVFKANDQEYYVRVSIGSSPGSATTSRATVASENVDESDKVSENKGPGLFEKWAAGAVERGADLISLGKVKNKKSDLTRPSSITGAIEGADVRLADDQDQAEENVVIEDDGDDIEPSL
jgi:hypothetical protein